MKNLTRFLAAGSASLIEPAFFSPSSFWISSATLKPTTRCKSLPRGLSLTLEVLRTFTVAVSCLFTPTLDAKCIGEISPQGRSDYLQVC